MTTENDHVIIRLDEWLANEAMTFEDVKLPDHEDYQSRMFAVEQTVKDLAASYATLCSALAQHPSIKFITENDDGQSNKY